ncbi:Release factor glutamine methyltransferase [Burkholderiales bacterium]|nr:MAG: peptide chain release factor N(5)-glutamine methyltransferase [Burkholderiales bacterium]CAG0976342.1 Release factor glutamine methyltransferase [Burkholderiales bacterium]
MDSKTPTPPQACVAELLCEAATLAGPEARLLLAHVAGQPKSWVVAHPEARLPGAMVRAFRELCARRLAGEPVAYLIGRREFFGLSLASTPAALIPRPDTELLVELALARIDAHGLTRVLDLGTGTGAIALAIAHARAQVDLTAAELDPEALALARQNARELGLDKLRLVASDWYQTLPQERWELIVANPPYIAAGDPHLLQGDLRFEPRAALTPGGDGLDALRAIIAGAPAYLTPDGTLLVEHGWDQGVAVRTLFGAAGFTDISTRRDLGGQERVTAGQLARDGQ